MQPEMFWSVFFIVLVFLGLLFYDLCCQHLAIVIFLPFLFLKHVLPVLFPFIIDPIVDYINPTSTFLLAVASTFYSFEYHLCVCSICVANTIYIVIDTIFKASMITIPFILAINNTINI